MSIALYALKATLPAFRSGVQKSRRGKNPHRSRPFYCVPNNIILIFSPFREIRPAHIHILGSTFHVIQKKPFLSSDTFHTSPILMIVTICTERLAKIMTFEAKQSRKGAMSPTKSFQPVTVGQKKSLSLSYLVLIILNLSQFEATTGTGIYISNRIKFPKLWKINQSRRLSPFWDRPFGETFGNEKERIVKQVQPAQLFVFSSMPSE